ARSATSPRPRPRCALRRRVGQAGPSPRRSTIHSSSKPRPWPSNKSRAVAFLGPMLEYPAKTLQDSDALDQDIVMFDFLHYFRKSPLQLAIQRGLQPGGDLSDEVGKLSDYRISSRRDGEAICAPLSNIKHAIKNPKK